jgi:redox-sensitive bicupin YhaK (pirin superfamily)
MTERSSARRIHAQRALEGEGFEVRVPFPTAQLDHLDPFLLLHHLGPVDLAPGAAKGAPDHPHRGFETVTYVLSGELDHEDSTGAVGRIETGGVQWMTAGAGVVHSEMPSARMREHGGRLEGVQLWVNLPAAEKMAAPRYQEVPAADIPEVTLAGARVRVVAGEAFGVRGPAETHSPIAYFHVTLEPHASLDVPAPADHSAMAYTLRGPDEGVLTVFNGDGDRVHIEAGDDLVELLVLTGRPLREPVARYGPFVMNTRAQLAEAFEDYQSGRMGAISRVASADASGRP